MRTMTWALPSGIAVVKMGPVGLLVFSPLLSQSERQTAETLALDADGLLVVVPYRRVYEVERQRPS